MCMTMHISHTCKGYNAEEERPDVTNLRCDAVLFEELQVVVFVGLELRDVALILQKRDDALRVGHPLSKIVQHLGNAMQ